MKVGRILTIAIFMSVAPSVIQAQVVWYVDGGVSASGGGTTWGSALKTIQEGIDYATASNLIPDQVWVRAGTYTPATATSTIQLEAGVHVFGGFSTGMETSLSQRNPNPATNGTVLSGELGSSGFTDNVKCIVTGKAGDGDFILDGFTITGARENAIKNHNAANGTYRNLIIEENESVSPGAAGIGMSCDSSDPTIEKCIFRLNRNLSTGAYAGALLIVGGTPRISECQFLNNEVTDSFGTEGGGAVHSSFGLPTFRLCTFADNKVQNGFGGAVFQDNGDIKFVLCDFHDNEVVADDDVYQGGAVFVQGHGETTLLNCRMWGNSVHDGSSNLMGAAGGMRLQKGAFVYNSEVRDNSAKVAGGILLSGTHGAQIQNCTIVRNRADTDGGGLYVTSQGAVGSHIQSCVIYGNTANCGTTCTDGELSQVRVANSSPGVAVHSCNIENYTSSGPLDTGIHVDNFGGDPLFVDPDGANQAFGDADDNFRLRPCSPCLDRADSTAFPVDIENLDDDEFTSEELLPELDLLTRAYDLPTTDAGSGTPDYLDVGAFELQLLGDVNFDALVNGADIQPFVLCFLSQGETSVAVTPSCANGDMNQDRYLAYGDIPCFVNVLVGGSGCFEPCEEGGEPRSGLDCNENEVDDAVDVLFCDLGEDPGLCDCNWNGIPDGCDIDDETSQDDDTNGIPDECEPDCNHNGTPDAKDIADTTSDDCDSNDVPDECDFDCDDNDVPDACQSVDPDCNENGIIDACENDCDESGVPDACELDGNDCNENGWLDSCDIDEGPPFGSLDANENDVPDECEEEMMMGGVEGGGESMMSGGGSCDASYWPADYSVLSNEMYTVWEEFMLWCMQENWGPDSTYSGAEQLERLIEKKFDVGICEDEISE